MAAMSDYLEDQLRKHFFTSSTVTLAKPSATWIALHTADPTDAGTGAEVNTGSYARVEMSASSAVWSESTATDGKLTNAVKVTFPTPTADWGSVGWTSIWDNSVGGNMLFHGPLDTAKTINNGDPAPEFATAALALTFA